MKIRKKHPLAFRWMHWINFPLLAIMIWSGLLIYWANGVYRIGWDDTTLLKFFPKNFYNFLHVPFRLAEGMSFHFAFMLLFTLNGFIYFGYLLFGGWRRLLPRREDWGNAWGVLLHDLHIRKTAPPQRGDYNAAQRIAYTMVAFMGIGSVLTGWAIYKPVQLGLLTTMLGGYAAARIEHFVLTLLFCLFFLVHVAQVAKAGWRNFQSMVTGAEPVEELPATAPEESVAVKSAS